MATTPRYGCWPSPLAATDVARAKVSVSDLSSDGDALYWLESRPADAGRVVLVRATSDGPRDHSPEGVSIRSRVHEYGGGAVCLIPRAEAGAFAYVDQADHRVWACDGPAGHGGPSSNSPRPLTDPAPQGELHYHGGLSATPDGLWILAVREVHTVPVRTAGDGTSIPPRRSVVALPVHGGEASTLMEGHDFYGSPRVNPAGDRVAVVAWDHPDMPWDASVLLVAPIGVGPPPPGGTRALLTAGSPALVAGGPEESVGQPGWGADGMLRFVSDRAGWWQPYLVEDAVGEGEGEDRAVRRLTEIEAEFHGPDWVLGQSTIATLPDGSLVIRMTSAGRDAVLALPPDGGAARVLEQPCVSIAAVCAHGEGFALIGSTPEDPVNVWTCVSPKPPTPLRPPAGRLLAPDDVARGEPFNLAGRTGRPVHGTLYRPPDRGQRGERGEAGSRPPLVVWCHGGPTSSCSAGLDLIVQFFTTRGFAVACVDYAGSSGYGRAYRCSLWGAWGVADAEDCLDAALHLAARGDVDAQRMAVRGGSAGGMTALNALASGEGFRACTSLYGVTDLLDLAATTHDFEAHYTDRLVGPLPEARDVYVERSPVSRAAAMTGSVLLLQGTEDAVVPPSQAERMRDALEAAGTRCDLVLFEAEGHGFRRAETMIASLESELAFYLEALRL